MSIDSHYYIGHSHKVCQDYTTQNHNSVIVSDGCSSSPNTDIGARLIALEAAHYYFHADTNYLFDDLTKPVIDGLNNLKFELRLENQVFDATLLALRVEPSDAAFNNFNVCCFGDGVIAKLRTDGSIHVTIIEYPSGAPYYISYKMDTVRSDKYISMFGTSKLIKTFLISENGIKNYNEIETDALDPYIINSTIPNTNTICVAIMSDGVLSLTKQSDSETSKKRIPVETSEVLKKLLSFKNFTGEFVTRRLQRFQKECIELGWQNYDDISIGAIYLGK